MFFLVGPARPAALMHSNAPYGSLASPPNCRQICKPSPRSLGFRVASQLSRPLTLVFSEICLPADWTGL